MSPQSLACCAVLLLGAALAVPAHAANTALQFGDGDFVRVPDAAALDMTGPFTVEAWVKAEASITAHSFKFIASKHYDGTGYTLLGAGTALQFESYSPMGSLGAPRTAKANDVLTVGTWMHVAGVWNGTHNLLYLNGRLAASALNPTPPVANTLDLLIGGSIFGYSWRGLIDEVRIWSYARSPQQVQGSRFASYSTPQAGLVGYWKFEEGAGSKANDSSGNRNDGTVASPLWAAADDLILAVGTSDPVAPAATTRYLAEGATSSFFNTRLALLNPGTTDTVATLRFLPTTGAPITHVVAAPAKRRVTIDVKDIPGLANAEFSTSIESAQLLVVDRTMSWGSGGYGTHSETAVASASPIWYLAEGATHSDFSLFYLLQNPSTSATTARVRYLRASGVPLVKEYQLPPQSRTNIWVNTEEFPGEGQALASADLSAVIETLDASPIIVERAMYRSTQGRLFNAGHESTGVTAPSLRWFLAEGATGPYFDSFVLIANPTALDAEVEVSYLLDGGQTYTRTLVAPANARSGVWIDVEQFAGVPGFPLADVAVSTTVTSTNRVPIVVERAMWWPGDGTTWHEAHNSAGATETGTRWAVAEGEVGGPGAQETYLLIANTSTLAGSALVTLYLEDGSTAMRTYALAPQSRTNVAVGPDFGAQVTGKRFSAIVESTGAEPAQIVVERAMYSSAGGVTWAAGTNSLATRVP